MILPRQNIYQNIKMKWYISPQINEFKNLEDSEVLISDFPGLRNLSILMDLNGLSDLTSLNSL